MSDERNEMDKWLITAMSHMKTVYEDNNIPWSKENEDMFQKIRQLIQKPEINEVFIIKKWADKFFRQYRISIGVEDFITQVIKDARGGGK